MEKRYTVRQAVTMTGVKSYVMRYWEEELDLHIGRNELGHRYYTPYDIQLFLKINELKSRGLQLKAIRTLIPRMERNTSGSVMPDAKILDGEAVEIEDIPLKETESRLQEEPQGFHKTENTHMSADIREEDFKITGQESAADDKILEFQEILERLIHEEMQRKKKANINAGRWMKRYGDSSRPEERRQLQQREKRTKKTEKTAGKNRQSFS